MKQHLLSFSLLSLSLVPNLSAFQSPHFPSSPQSPNSNSHHKTITTTPAPISSSSPPPVTTKNPLIIFPDFEFTPDGICTNPRHFVDSQSRQWFTLRNVPGEGDCMFLAVAVAASFPPQFTSGSNSGSSSGKVPYPTHPPNHDPKHHNHPNPMALEQNFLSQERNVLHDFPPPPKDVATPSDASILLDQDSSYWHHLAKNIREQVALVLESSPTEPLYIGKNRPLVQPVDLLRSATRQEGLSSTRDYLKLLRTLGRQGGLYGGGPELTVLSNLLQRPIAIYEVATDGNTTTTSSSSIVRNGICPIVCRGIFGDGQFDHPPMSNHHHNNKKNVMSKDDGLDHWKLHVLVVDASPQEKHACVLIPLPKQQFKLP